MKGTFYGLGVGPGDPDLITVKSLKILQGADVIVTPTKKMGKPSIAYRIVESHIPQGTEVIEMNFPMISLSEERETLQKQWAENADAIEVMLKDGKDVVFLTLGDPMVFSTYSYIMEFLVERDIEVVTLSGIPSFCNLAAQVGIPLTQGEESLGVVAMTQPMEEIRAILDAHKNIVVMKVSADNAKLAEELKTRGLEKQFILVSNIGMDTQSVVRDIEVLAGKIPYLSTVLIKKDYDLGE
ncbi:MAG: precorrin-2 C(20)-methyltransferase [Eubacterium aggregans]|uniref:Precorrin-2 C20-methyltransferase /cobalt-factor II C20-methyltransferase n=1 Tax=Eubacterium aggregans TaxID=81409 RepID=A0A1H3YT32_9FIRM|nr:precorrin-2 C(20)-methyltransferase [Eubacterium aggregans]MDD4691249.1 precorrin-2 C(20)-methyltransferase [Eubacterium aggregans]MEA5074437.1 precorrin-2 C(20)-methyltransferase [Eubacterium aggregans]SEA14212.1 precorrin-2 C20-methyltransferase /cobalt-factor II C20-methyltransferase [Eubacterium aggregans]